MPKKYAYPPETLQILESLWTQGMQNCSTDENKLKIQQASVATGLVDERIKSWIYSRNRKKKRDDEGQSKAKKSCSTASNARISTEASQDQPSVGTCPSSQEHTSEYLGGEKCLNWTAYPQGFLEDVTQNQDRTEEADSECSRQGQEGPSQDSSSSDEYVNRTTETDPSVQDSDKDSQQGAAASLIQVVEGKVQELHACNCDVIVLVYNHSSRCLSTTGTLKGLDFLSSQNPGIDLQFAAAVSVSSCDYALT